jgi:hypothetical protein
VVVVVVVLVVPVAVADGDHSGHGHGHGHVYDLSRLARDYEPRGTPMAKPAASNCLKMSGQRS